MIGLHTCDGTDRHFTVKQISIVPGSPGSWWNQNWEDKIAQCFQSSPCVCVREFEDSLAPTGPPRKLQVKNVMNTLGNWSRTSSSSSSLSSLKGTHFFLFCITKIQKRIWAPPKTKTSWNCRSVVVVFIIILPFWRGDPNRLLHSSSSRTCVDYHGPGRWWLSCCPVDWSGPSLSLSLSL